MKNRMKTIFVLLAMGVVSNGIGQDKKTTQDYIEKIFYEIKSYEEKHDNGNVYSIANISFCHYSSESVEINLSCKYGRLSYGRYARTDGYCTYGYEYTNIDWAKMQSIEDGMHTSDNSPIKYLQISFTPNSVLRKGYISESCSIADFSFCGKTISVSSISFPYRNEEGKRERLVKALNHLSSIAKEEAKANDPFAE